jgi:hypothetical protein
LIVRKSGPSHGDEDVHRFLALLRPRALPDRDAPSAWHRLDTRARLRGPRHHSEPLIGYAFAWFSHFFVEHNKPATFGHPFYSLAADYVMVFKMLTGRMGAEVEKHCRQR